MRTICLGIFLCSATLAPLAKAQPGTSTLSIMQPAPPIKVAAWIKGDPVSQFEEGHVYVMEFGSISCGPCRVAIPHLTAMAKRFQGKVDVVSVFIYENSRTRAGMDYIQRVRDFIEKQSAKVGYKVAVDDEAQTMAKSWYEPAARAKMLGMPATFVVDGHGQIVWIGSPFDAEDVIAKVLEGDFDPVMATGLQHKFASVNRRIFKAKSERHFDTALKLADSLITRHPGIYSWKHIRFEILLESDIPAALEYGRQLLSDECLDSEGTLTNLARAIIAKSHLDEYRKTDDLWDLAVYLTDRALVLSKSDLISSHLYGLQAEAFAKKQDFVRAVKAQELAIEWLRREEHQGGSVSAGTKEQLNRTLNAYKDSLRTGG